MPAAEQVQMQVIHRLPPVVPCVDDDAITLIQLLFARNLCRRGHQMAHQRRVFRPRLRRRTDVLFGDDQ